MLWPPETELFGYGCPLAEKCDPAVFYKRIRQYLSGWNNNPALPDGLIYEGIC